MELAHRDRAGPAQNVREELVALNFKVPLQFRLAFKVCAARRNMTMTELLLELVEKCLNADAMSDPTFKEIKK